MNAKGAGPLTGGEATPTPPRGQPAPPPPSRSPEIRPADARAEGHDRAMALCAHCPKLCRHSCPVAVGEGSEAATPASKGTLIHLFNKGLLPLAGSVAEAAYRCTNCRLQQQDCLHGIAVQESFHPIRVEAVANGVEPEKVRSYLERVRSCGNPFQENLGDLLREIVGAGAAPNPAGDARPTLFPGCAAISRTPAAIRNAVAVLSRVGGMREADVGSTVAVTGEVCCGYPLYAGGDLEGFRSLAALCAESLCGAQQVIVSDPGCAYTFRKLYARVGVRLRPEVTTLVEYLHARLPALRRAIQAPITEVVAYHDPCHLGRYAGIYDAPRALLSAACGGQAPRELANHHEHAWCSGAGGIYPKTAPEGARAIAARRLAEFDETTATVLATACPSCVRHLGRDEAPGRVENVVNLVARALGCAVK